MPPYRAYREGDVSRSDSPSSPGVTIDKGATGVPLCRRFLSGSPFRIFSTARETKYTDVITVTSAGSALSVLAHLRSTTSTSLRRTRASADFREPRRIFPRDPPGTSVDHSGLPVNRGAPRRFSPWSSPCPSRPKPLATAKVRMATFESRAKNRLTTTSGAAPVSLISLLRRDGPGAPSRRDPHRLHHRRLHRGLRTRRSPSAVTIGTRQR
jgi:hypothetical protein